MAKREYMIDLQESAVTKLKELIAEEGNPNLKLRIFVQGGGCSGFQYGFTFDEDQKEDDFDLEFGGVGLLVDSMSAFIKQIFFNRMWKQCALPISKYLIALTIFARFFNCHL